MLARVVLARLSFVPAAVVLSHYGNGGTSSMMRCLTGYIVLLALTFGARFASGRWRRIDFTGRRRPLAWSPPIPRALLDSSSGKTLVWRAGPPRVRTS